MAIKVSNQGSVPAIDVDYIQFSSFKLSVSKVAPYTINVSATVNPYGKDSDGARHYVGERKFAIGDLKQYILALDDNAQKAKAAEAMKKVNEGLGVLAEIRLGIEFDSYE